MNSNPPQFQSHLVQQEKKRGHNARRGHEKKGAPTGSPMINPSGFQRICPSPHWLSCSEGHAELSLAYSCEQHRATKQAWWWAHATWCHISYSIIQHPVAEMAGHFKKQVLVNWLKNDAQPEFLHFSDPKSPVVSGSVLFQPPRPRGSQRKEKPKPRSPRTCLKTTVGHDSNRDRKYVGKITRWNTNRVKRQVT